ncbi:NADAR family protein [Nannocystis pusilla]|uniref:NADAR family protein n=1 Tax=Nannocystis pusilla TaxID=889268 RepID=A0A9X3EQJ3_9BACT|nr:NADAR family protein [Nannocystis pusilla]MCY1008333.1 NADAR family protein [Nannocystis pusilla]
MPDAIEFYLPADPYGELSNFAPFPIKLGGKKWPTSEHYFQAQKFAGTSHEEDIRRAKKPKLAAEMGRDRKRPLRRDWESVKERVMLDALRAKFTQHADLRELLLGTGDARLVEHTANDAYWGDGGDGSGKNRLGQLLMQLRAELREAR